VACQVEERVGEGPGRRQRAAEGWHRPARGGRGWCGDMERLGLGRKLADGWVPWHSSGARSNEFESDSKFKRFLEIQILPKFDRSKRDLSEMKNFEMKYGCEGV
jgi:hypothetical protein